MPELPEVEVLVRHLKPLVVGKRIRSVNVGRASVLAPTTVEVFRRGLKGARFVSLGRRGKYLLFGLQKSARHEPFQLLGHLGMTGRMYVSKKKQPMPKHLAAAFDLGNEKLVFEDTRYFGRLTLDTRVLNKLGPEPLEKDFTVENLAAALRASRQPIKIKLLDQSLLARGWEYLRKRSSLRSPYFAETAGPVPHERAGSPIAARDSEGADPRHRLRQHRSVELCRHFWQ